MKFHRATEELAKIGRDFYQRNWVLGTSGNFSAVLNRTPFEVCITASGNDKGQLSEQNFLEIDKAGKVVGGAGTPSAETLLHLTIYDVFPKVNSVLHTHSVFGTILSDQYFRKGFIELKGYEMLKGLSGVKSHEHSEYLPIIGNSQNYQMLAHIIRSVAIRNPEIHGIYLHRHGLYTWGTDISEAKRHIEIFEFLFQVLQQSR